MRSSLPVANASPTSQQKGDWFARLAVTTSKISGKPATFLLAVAVVVIWAVTGPLFRFSDTIDRSAALLLGRIMSRNCRAHLLG